MEKIREWLKFNEIIFTTIASILVSLMAILLSYNSNRLVEKQIEVEYLDKQPVFKIYGNYVITDKTNKANDFVLDVYHVSGKYRNAGLDIKSFIRFTLTDSLLSKSVFYFQLYDYLDNVRSYENDQGLIFRASSWNNNNNFLNLKKMLNKRLREFENIEYVEIDLITICEVSFLDFTNKNCKEYFQFDGVQASYINKHNRYVMEFKDDISNLRKEEISFDLFDIGDKKVEIYTKKIITEFFNYNRGVQNSKSTLGRPLEGGR